MDYRKFLKIIKTKEEYEAALDAVYSLTEQKKVRPKLNI